MLGEIKTVFDLADIAQAWLIRAIKSRRDKKKQTSVHVLATSGVLIAAFHTLLSTYKSLLGQFSLFDLSWTPDYKDEQTRKLQEFVQWERLIPLIEQKVAELAELLPNIHEEDKEFVKTLLSYGRIILDSLGPSDINPVWPDNRSFFEFLRTIRNARSEAQVATVTDTAESGLEKIIPLFQSEADVGYGRLRARILKRHPDLVPPDWDRNLSLTAFMKTS
jgi:hypothetical protein